MKKRTFFTIIFVLLSSIITAVICHSREIEEGYITTPDGVRLFYKVVGKGPSTLVVVHGGPGNTMESILPDFTPLTANHRIIYYDQRGNGRSDLVGDEKELAIDRHIEDIEAIRKHFKIARMTLLGNSWGGLLASYYAVRYPEHIDKLILHGAASPSYAHMRAFAPQIISRIPAANRAEFRTISNPIKWLSGNNPRRVCRRFYELLVPVYFTNPENARFMQGDVCSGPEDAVRRQQATNMLIWQSLGEWNILPELQVVQSPTLVIHAEDDMIPTTSSRDWAEAFPDARMLIIKNAGHMSHIEQPEFFFSAIETFLKGEWPAKSIDIKKKKDLLADDFPVPAKDHQLKTDEKPQIPTLPVI